MQLQLVKQLSTHSTLPRTTAGPYLAQEGDRSGFRRSRAPMFGRNMTLLALQKPGAPNYFSILRPNTGESFFDMEVRSLSAHSLSPSHPASHLSNACVLVKLQMNVLAAFCSPTSSACTLREDVATTIA